MSRYGPQGNYQLPAAPVLLIEPFVASMISHPEIGTGLI
jgi:hypothetical protein